MIPHYYEKKQGTYVLQVGPFRRYTIDKINSKRWKWAEELFNNGKWSVTSSGTKKTFKDCVFAVEVDNQFKPKTVGYPPRNPWSEPETDRRTPPITPDQVKPSVSIPNKVIEVFNLLISANHRNGSSRVLQKEVVNQLVAVGFDRNKIFQEKLLDVEEVYREAGWEVKYDQPGYNENHYEPYFVFRKKSNG